MKDQLKMSVPDMSCAGCAASVQNALTSEPGVTGVDVDMDSKQITVDYNADQTTPDKLRDRVYDAGFDVMVI